MAPNVYERGRRDGARGRARATFDDQPAHGLWAKHLAFHNRNVETDDCGLDCPGVTWLSEDLRKERRQTPDGLPNSRHVCPVCKSDWLTEFRTQERAQYTAGFEAGLAQYARDQQRKRSDQQRRARRARHH
jgi:hypothetical protein